MRNRLGYVERSPTVDKTCATCTQFVPAASESACGGCKVMKGPIHPDGTCKVYAKTG